MMLTGVKAFCKAKSVLKSYVKILSDTSNICMYCDTGITPGASFAVFDCRIIMLLSVVC